MNYRLKGSEIAAITISYKGVIQKKLQYMIWTKWRRKSHYAPGMFARL